MGAITKVVIDTNVFISAFGWDGKPEAVLRLMEQRKIVNLITNAIEAMRGGGKLMLSLRSGIDWRTNRPGVRVTIADTGSGMSPETRRKIYQAFFTTKGPEGSGVGLWVSANIVDKHQGSIHVRSRKTPGASGTVFTVIFPDGGVEGKRPGFTGPNSDPIA